MRAIVQRVSRASVTVEGKIVGRCGVGLCVLVAAHREDTQERVVKMADRLEKIRIFNDAEGKMNLALGELPESADAQILLISNFTVYGETAKNRRPSFIESAPYAEGEAWYEALAAELARRGLRVEKGVFGAHMDVEIVNDGPVTVIVET